MRRRLRLLREELLLQKRMCRLMISHSSEDWKCLNCLNLDCREKSNEFEIKGLAELQLKEQEIWDQLEFDYQQRRLVKKDNL